MDSIYINLRLFLFCLFLTVFGCFGAAEPTNTANAQSAIDDLATLRQKLQSDRPMTWVFTGDSITHGAYHTNGWRSYPELFAERLRWEIKRTSDIVINTGISGNRTGNILKDIDWRVSRFKPDVVSIMIGTNDCVAVEKGYDDFRKNLMEITDLIHADGGIVILNTPNPICPDSYNGTRTDLDKYVKIICDVASEKKIVLVDHWAYWQQQKKSLDALMIWLNDSIHPNEYGHRAIAVEIFRAIGIFAPDSPTCKLYIP